VGGQAELVEQAIELIQRSKGNGYFALLPTESAFFECRPANLSLNSVPLPPNKGWKSKKDGLMIVSPFSLNGNLYLITSDYTGLTYVSQVKFKTRFDSIKKSTN
jgi:hypothetical protein